MSNATGNYRSQFFTGEVEGFGYLAVTKISVKDAGPHFCFFGETKEKAVDKAQAALKFYIDYKLNKEGLGQGTSNVSVSVARRLPFKSVEQVFVPKEVVFACA